MKKQVIAISSKELAQIVHSELMQIGVHNADDIYEELVSQKDGVLLINPGDGVKILEVDDL